jgi:hypothetical protein
VSNSHQKDLLRHEGFVHGFVAARNPTSHHDTLRALEEAERAWIIHTELRKVAAAR